MVSLVVVCWNALEYTKITLESLFETVKNNYNLVIINNGSKKDTKYFLDNLTFPYNVHHFRGKSMASNSENTADILIKIFNTLKEERYG